MIDCVHHPRPCMPSPLDLDTIIVDLTPFGMPGRYEKLKVDLSPEGNYVVACLPFFTYGIQFGDLIAVREPDKLFERVLKRSGLRTLRLALSDPAVADKRHEVLHAKIIGMGLPHEWHCSGYVSVLLRSATDQKLALNCVEEAIRIGNVCWEVDPEPFAVDATEPGAALDPGSM